MSYSWEVVYDHRDFASAQRLEADRTIWACGRPCFSGKSAGAEFNALDVVRMFTEEFPQLRLLSVRRGRRNAVEKVVKKPFREMGIADRVILAGYCRYHRLVAAYRAMDLLVYPIPGTDKSCRTVREAMAPGVPVIAPRIGFLPEAIENGLNGRLVDLSSESLAHILEKLVKTPGLTRDKKEAKKSISNLGLFSYRRSGTCDT